MFFRSLDNPIMVAGYTVKGDSFVADKPKVWSEKRLANVGLNGSYDVAPDGKRVAALMPFEAPEAKQDQNQVVVVLNFLDDLRRKMPLNGK